MPTAQIFLDEEVDEKVRTLAAYWNLSKNESISKLIRLTDVSRIVGGDKNVQSD